MPRIRHIKPEFFTHEQLNDLESQHPELRPMLTFAGLWCFADGKGFFRYSIRTIHNNILPFVNYDIQAALELLAEKGFIKIYPPAEDGSIIGEVVNFKVHQYVSSTERSKYQAPKPKPAEPEAPAQMAIPTIPAPPAGIIEQLTGELFVEEICMNNAFDKDEFTAFAQQWAKNKAICKDDKYPVPKLRRFLIDDFKKELKERKPNGSKIKQRGEKFVAV